MAAYFALIALENMQPKLTFKLKQQNSPFND